MVPSTTSSASPFLGEEEANKTPSVLPGTTQPQPVPSVSLLGLAQSLVPGRVVLRWVQGRELPLTDCQDKDGKDTNHLPEAQPPDHHRLRSDRVRLLFGGFCGGLGKRREKKEKSGLRLARGKMPLRGAGEPLSSGLTIIQISSGNGNFSRGHI